MPAYNFKSIQTVPTAKDFIDIVLSKTQRQTPTVVHNGWSINRIRQFYMRKVKFTQSSWHEKISTVIDQFPKIEDIHPFYADLLNVLYDKDHYKLALGQLNIARNLIDKICQDYVRLLKYGDSLYRCKQLKRAALGRMCTLMKKMTASLAYLEQVRQHLSRLPSIDPNTRTLLVCGYPNVGKSSFINKVTRADVEVQPYAFTTKSLYVGHMDYKYLRWQVIDTPGILDRPLEERNTIEMQSITALAHLRACVLYLVDPSEQCGYSLAQQAALFHSIKPLFSNKPVMIVCNKMDAMKLEDLPAASRALIDEMAEEAGRIGNGGMPMDAAQRAGTPTLLTMSTLTESGVSEVKQAACERLLASRVELKLKTKKINDVLNRMHVAVPKTMNAAARPPVIPPNLEHARALRDAGQKRRTERDAQEEAGGAGVYSADDRKRYLLEKDEWKYDIMPEIWDGHNVADFIDADIDAKLAALEQEEEALSKAWDEYLEEHPSDQDLDPDDAQILEKIRLRKKEILKEHRTKKARNSNNPVIPRSRAGNVVQANDMKEKLEALGMDADKAVARARSMSRVGRKRTRSETREGGARGGAGAGGAMGEEGGAEPANKKRVHSKPSRSMSRGRSHSLVAPRANEGLRDATMRNRALKMADRSQFKMNMNARAGEADRHIPTKMPKHLFSGKRGMGKTDRR